MAIAEAQPFGASETDPIAKLIRQGLHRDAISACAREYGASLGRLCMALLGSQAEAEETVQEALIAAHDGMSQWRGEGSVKSWIYGIARRMCARRLETRVRRDRRLRLVHDADADAKLPDDLVETGRRARRIRDALEELKPSEREALLLRYESGLSFKEVALACGVDEAAARKRASRAIARLRVLLQEEVG